MAQKKRKTTAKKTTARRKPRTLSVRMHGEDKPKRRSKPKSKTSGLVQEITHSLAISAGQIAARMIHEKTAATMDSKIIGGVALLGGAFGATKTTNPLIKYALNGASSYGANTVLKTFAPTLSGEAEMLGADDQQLINAINGEAEMLGVEMLGEPETSGNTQMMGKFNL